VSIPRKITVSCPKCGKRFEALIFDSLNTDYSSDIATKIISGELFDAKCPKCGSIAHLEYDMLYHDLKHKAMIWVGHTNSENYDSRVAEMRATQQLPDYMTRIVPDMNALREKVACLEADVDDQVMELFKLLLEHQLIEENPDFKIRNSFFTYADNKLIVFFYDMNGKEMHCYFEYEQYDAFEDIYRERLLKMGNKPFQIIDRMWAIQFYKEMPTEENIGTEKNPMEEREKDNEPDEYDDFLAKYAKNSVGKEPERKKKERTDPQPTPPKNEDAIPNSKATVESQKTTATKPHEAENKNTTQRQAPVESPETAKDNSDPAEVLYDRSERISQGNLPIVLERTTLKQIANGTVILCCAFRSTSVESIRAVQVDVKCLDVWNEPLQPVEGYQYLDLKTKRDSSFGENTPIPIPDPRTRNVEVQIRRIALASGEVLLRKEDKTSVSEPRRTEHKSDDKENQKSNSIHPGSNDKNTKRFLGLPVKVWLIGVGCVAVVALASYFIIKGKLLNVDPPAQVVQEQQTYTVLLNRDEGEGGTTVITVANGSVLPLAYAPTKRGYAFRGYYSERNGHGTIYYNYAMECAKRWDKESDGTLYAHWVKRPETSFSNDSLVGDPVYVDIRSIAPKYGIVDPLTGEYSAFVCECETHSGPIVWILLKSSTYKTFYDYRVDLKGDPSLNEKKTFEKRRIHGNVITSGSVLTDLPDKTATKIIEFYSQD
jgi:hypothetical protein